MAGAEIVGGSSCGVKAFAPGMESSPFSTTIGNHVRSSRERHACDQSHGRTAPKSREDRVLGGGSKIVEGYRGGFAKAKICRSSLIQMLSGVHVCVMSSVSMAN